MKEGIAYTGIPSAEELGSCAGIPTRERMAKGPVAVIECIQCIPCNPCEMACPTGAISLGGAISNAPKLDGDKCIGCGKCVARCPGQAITVLNMAYSADKATLDFPYEFLPLPAEGDTVRAVNRAARRSARPPCSPCASRRRTTAPASSASPSPPNTRAR